MRSAGNEQPDDNRKISDRPAQQGKNEGLPGDHTLIALDRQWHGFDGLRHQLECHYDATRSLRKAQGGSYSI